MSQRNKADILADIRAIRANEDNYTVMTVRADPYSLVAKRMMELLPTSEVFAGMSFKEVRAYCKDPIMTAFYNSRRQPEKAFGEDTLELSAFYQTLNELFPGAMNVLDAINERWDKDAMFHEWLTPDGHVSHCKVINTIKGHLSTQGLELEYTFKENGTSETSTPLAPNFVHSADGFAVRFVVISAKHEGFQCVHIHDEYDAHPNNMDRVQELYLEAIKLVATSRMLEEFCGQDFGIVLDDFLEKMEKSKYSLC